MSTEIKELQYDEAYVKSFSEKREEPEWFLDLRLKGLELSGELPMPKPEKTRIIGWNFTNFDHHVPTDKVTETTDLSNEVQRLLGQDEEAGNVLVHQNGSLIYDALSSELKDKGVIFTDLKTALKEHSDLVKKYYYGEAATIDEHKLTALNAALVNSGTFLYIPKNVEVSVPLQSIYSQTVDQAGFINHVIVVAETNSSVTYVENYFSTEEQKEAVANIIAEVYVGDNARVQFGAVDTFGEGVTTFVNRRGVVSRDGKLEWALGQMNDGNTISENFTILSGDGSIADTKAVSIGRGDQRQNFVNYIKHYGRNTESNILIHGVQKEASNSIFNGITKIEHGATKSNGEQTQRVLMLSEQARGDANPILLIDEDDVIAGHAASVGRIDPIQLYYLMSRGIPRKDAERLVIHGFLAPVVDELPIKGVKEQLVDVIERKVR